MNADKRKQLKNDYKSKPAQGAVYAIECSGNHRRIVKSTVDIGGIQSRFAFAMAIKGCPDPALNSEFLQYGPESFSLTILEELKMKEDQSPREFAEDMKQLCVLWLEKYAEDEAKES